MKLLLPMILTLGACAATPPPEPAAADACARVAASGWQLVATATGARLTGAAEVPTGGWTVAFRPRADGTVALVATPPEGMATQAFVTHPLSLDLPHGTAAVRILCGERLLATVTSGAPR